MYNMAYFEQTLIFLFFWGTPGDLDLKRAISQFAQAGNLALFSGGSRPVFTNFFSLRMHFFNSKDFRMHLLYLWGKCEIK